MGIFERFRTPKQEEPQPIKERVLAPNFEINEELESVIKEYVDLSETMFGITHDSGIDMNTDINKPKIQESPELKEMAEKYFQAKDRKAEIETSYGDRMSEYLGPYMNLGDPSQFGYGVSRDEWNRYRMANTLRKKAEDTRKNA